MNEKKHKHFPNPTIIEAVVEMRFAKLLEPIDNENLEGNFGSALKKDELDVYTASFNPTGMSLQHDKSKQIRFKLNLGEQIFVQIFPDRVSFHCLGKYPGWASFQDEFESFRKKLCLALPNLQILQVGVRFINKLEQKKIDQNLSFWLKPSPNYPKNILAMKSNYFYRWKWPLKINRWAQVCIAEAQITDNLKPLMFDIDVIQQIEKPIKLKPALSALAAELHDDVFDIFINSISLKYKKILNSKQKGA